MQDDIRRGNDGLGAVIGLAGDGENSLVSVGRIAGLREVGRCASSVELWQIILGGHRVNNETCFLPGILLGDVAGLPLCPEQ
jgi:hypothetical protein